ncbi:hypothetical protein HpNP70_13480 [Helicobacter pylori]
MKPRIGFLKPRTKSLENLKMILINLEDMKELVRREVEYQVSKNSADTQTQKYIYFQNDDSQGSLIKIH